MDPEQEPKLSDKSYVDIDPSIDPKNLVIQEGKDKGIINAFDTERGTSLTDSGEIKAGVEASEQPYTIEGLPLIGAEAEEKARNEIKEIGEPAHYPEHTRPFEPGEMEAYVDKQGTEAMAAEVKNRAVELAKKQFPFASQELVDQFGQKAADKFKAELELKNAEKKVEHDKGVQTMIDSLDSPDTPLSSIVPESESEAAKAFK